MYSRICIFGRPGSGKSTFAYNLHKKVGIPLYHLDRYFFISNWVERDYQQFLEMQEAIVNQSAWIIDGNSLKSLETRYARADICLYFNYPRWLCLVRLIKRLFLKDSAIKDRAEGCKERISWKLIKYMWTFEQRINKYSEELQTKYPHVKFIEIHTNADLKEAYKIFS